MYKQKFYIWGRRNDPSTSWAAGKFSAVSQEKCRSSEESVEESYKQVRGSENKTCEERTGFFCC